MLEFFKLMFLFREISLPEKNEIRVSLKRIYVLDDINQI